MITIKIIMNKKIIMRQNKAYALQNEMTSHTQTPNTGDYDDNNNNSSSQICRLAQTNKPKKRKIS